MKNSKALGISDNLLWIYTVLVAVTFANLFVTQSNVVGCVEIC